MTKPIVSRHRSARVLSGAAILSLLAACPADAAQIDIAGPAGSVNFGTNVTVLPNGNFVVCDTDGPASGVGAVYLYGANGVQISALTGAAANDHICSDGLVVLPSGNFLVQSSQWHNGALANAGAVTFINGSTGLSGAVTAANSLVGSSSNDRVGGNSVFPAVRLLSNGNYLVVTGTWKNGGASNAGAVTWGSGTAGVSGAISAANSLVGTAAVDNVGANVVALSNGNYVVSEGTWDNGGAGNVGAATWGNGNSGISGAVSAANSLIGATPGDLVGQRLIALPNGNYVVGSPFWSNGTASVGAATWANGSTGRIGTVTGANSIVGATASDAFGENLVALTNGNYVVACQSCDIGGVVDAGAVAWAVGSGPTSAVLGTANALVGSTTGDSVGFLVAPLANGNYVVGSPLWHNGATANAGAATFGNGSTGLVGVVSAANSVVGTSASDSIGSDVVVLPNGNYVLRNPSWDNGGTLNAGAATFGNGTTGVSGVVSAANSLVGLSANDGVGGAGILVLSNGNYVVQAASFDNGSALDAGAATWGNGSTGTTGIVSPLNSLVGTSNSDAIGNSVVALANGNYVVNTQVWHNGALASAGAVTLGSGTSGIAGPVSASNSLVGSSASDFVGTSILPLSNGNFVVASQSWSNGGTADVGALTLVSGTTGLTGPVTPSNSLIGITSGDGIGGGTLLAGSDGYIVSVARNFDNGASANVGAASLFDGSQPLTGMPTTTNSVFGTAVNMSSTINVAYDASRHRLIVGRPASNLVSLFTIGVDLFKDGFE